MPACADVWVSWPVQLRQPFEEPRLTRVLFTERADAIRKRLRFAVLTSQRLQVEEQGDGLFVAVGVAFCNRRIDLVPDPCAPAPDASQAYLPRLFGFSRLPLPLGLASFGFDGLARCAYLVRTVEKVRDRPALVYASPVASATALRTRAWTSAATCGSPLARR